MQALTTTNKKQIKCPSCGQTITWNTSEQKTIMGNRVITCSQCGANLIVPRTELQPYFEEYPISYTDNIFGEEGSSSTGSNLLELLLNYEDSYDDYFFYSLEEYSKDEILQAADNDKLDSTIWLETSNGGWESGYIDNIDIPETPEENEFLTFNILRPGSNYIYIYYCKLTEYEGSIQAVINDELTQTYIAPEEKMELSFSKSANGWICNHTYQQIGALNGLYKVDTHIKIDNSSKNLVAYSFVAGDNGGFIFYCIGSFSYGSSSGTAYKIKIQSDDTITITEKTITLGTESTVDGISMADLN